MIDALSVDRYGNYIMSFDTAVVLGGVTVEDEDLVSFNGSTFTLFFKGSQAGAPTDLDLDAVGVDGSGKLHLSFDGSGVRDGLRLTTRMCCYTIPLETNGFWNLEERHTTPAGYPQTTRNGQSRVDLTIGSALDIFGGTGVKYVDVVEFKRRQAR